MTLPTQAAPADEHPTVVLPRVGGPAPTSGDDVVSWHQVADLDGLEQSEDCFFECTCSRDTTGWQRFLSESDAITKGCTTAMARWESTASASAAAVANRPQPPRPEA